MKRFNGFFYLFVLLSVTIVLARPGDNTSLTQAMDLLLQNKYDQAVQKLTTLIADDPQNVRAYRLLGAAYQSLRQYDKAAEAFSKALELDPADVRIGVALGKALFQAGRYPAAEKALLKALQSDSANISARIQLARLYFQQGKYRLALPVYRSLIRENPVNSYFLKQAGKCAAKLGNHKSAVRYLEKALKLNTEDLEIYILLFNQFKKQEDWESVLPVVNTGLAVYPSNPKLLLARGDAYFSLQKYDKAAADYLNAMNRGDTTAYLFKKLGVSYYYINDFGAALLALQKSVQKNAQDPIAFYILGLTQKELNMPDKAISSLNKALRLSVPDYISDVYFHLADSYNKNKQYRQALDAYKKVLEYNPQRKLVLFYMATIYDRYYKDRQTPLRYYQKFLEEAPDDVEARYKNYALERMKTIREKLHFQKGRKLQQKGGQNEN
ncbi:MAG: tetratricopeptide repeat protein [Calditrichaeota bacterium]|nr:tetratricopeptide repeat protein [Calditrichota bacterium]